MSNKNIEDDTRQQISRFLPDAIARALTAYHEFTKSDAEEKDCKKFAANHAACKAAVAHIELLIKLAKWAELPDAKAEDHNNQIVLAAMMQEAQDELTDYNEK